MIITLDGTPGSGKTTVGKRVAESLKYDFFSAGDHMREISKRNKITLHELQDIREKNTNADDEVDKYQEKLGKTRDNFIITGRTSFHFIPHAIKIFLKVDYKTAGARIWKDINVSDQRNEGTYANLHEVERKTKERNERDREIYKKYYHLDVNDVMNYDLVLDTSHLTIDQVTAIVKVYVMERKNSRLEQK
jgi:cytidylate kinase